MIDISNATRMENIAMTKNEFFTYFKYKINKENNVVFIIIFTDTLNDLIIIKNIFFTFILLIKGMTGKNSHRAG